MGWESRAREGRQATLAGAKVVVDVQHLYRDHKPRDRGSVYTLANGLKVSEGDAALIYAQALTTFLRAHGAQVLTNDPAHGILVGYYSRRNAAAKAWEAHAYLACHVNAGGGDYAAFLYMSTTIGADLAGAMLPQLRNAFPTAILSSRRVSLSSETRGSDCIERVSPSCAAIVCEPFFGDNPRHQHLLSTPQLVKVGEALGRGVVEWWQARRATV